MKKSNFSLFVLLFLWFVIWSCSSHDNTSKTVDKKDLRTDTALLADANFSLKNLKNTGELWKNHKFYNDKLYADSTHKLSFRQLTKAQKAKLVQPFVSKDIPVADPKTIPDLMNAYFISKQDKVGEYQPVILFIDGDDYTALTLIVLDKNNNYVSGFNLCGGFNSGPWMQGDTVTAFPDNRISFFNKNQITSYQVSEYLYPDSLKKSSIKDSIVINSYIDKNGKIDSKTVFKKRYQIPFKKHGF